MQRSIVAASLDFYSSQLSPLPRAVLQAQILAIVVVVFPLGCDAARRTWGWQTALPRRALQQTQHAPTSVYGPMTGVGGVKSCRDTTTTRYPARRWVIKGEAVSSCSGSSAVRSPTHTELIARRRRYWGGWRGGTKRTVWADAGA